MTRYFGTFRFDIETFPHGKMLELFAKVIPLRVEHLFPERVFVCTGWSIELFDCLEEGEMIPEYQIVFSEDGIKANRTT